jgi:BON domain
LLSHRSTSALRTTVETTDGVVTVSGIAKKAAKKSLVTKLVNDIDGVSSVVNNMTIAVPVAKNQLGPSRLAGANAHQPLGVYVRHFDANFGASFPGLGWLVPLWHRVLLEFF